MKTQFSHPQADTAGPRRPTIKVDHCDHQSRAAAPYLLRLEAAFERVFALAFVACDGGRL